MKPDGRILVIGAGVNGSVCAAALHRAGYDVTVLARGKRLEELQKRGIEIEDPLKGTRTVTQVPVVDQLASADIYEYVLVVVLKNQVRDLLPALAQNQSQSVVFMVNTTSGPDEWIAALGAKRVMLGFVFAGGRREGSLIRAIRGRHASPFGEANGANTERLTRLVSTLNSAGLGANIVKAVVASAINEKGEELFPRKWNVGFIDAPIVKHQRQPSTDRNGMNAILAEATGQYRVLYALLAGCGPLRAGEALGLEIDKHISQDCRTLYVRQKAKRGLIQPYLKTQNGERDVDICTSLARMLEQHIGNRTKGLLFATSTGAQLLQANTLQDSLHPILKKLEHEKGGFNIFRRFRITELKKSDCPDALQHFWSGHVPTHVSERYAKLSQDRAYRLEWAEKIGMGFELPAAAVAPRAPLIMFRKTG